MSSNRIIIRSRVLCAWICVFHLLSTATGFVNSPKIITKDGNLVFESGMNRNITFRLNGKSRITINDQYDLLDLILLKKRVRNSTSSDLNSGDTELDGEETNLRKLANDVNALNVRVFGPQGIDNRLRDLQNRSNTATQSLRRYNSRLQRIETRVQGLYTRLELDSCKSDPCENGGTCFNLYNGFMCKCTKNFEGPTCEQDVNECALFAGTDLGCQNGGQCVNQFGGYSCICTPGWFGIHCSQRKGDCMQSSAWELCGHGTCVPAAGNDNFGYKCICEQGWKTNGLTPACLVDVDECTESHPPCVTKCINLPGGFTCAACPAGLDGNGVNCRDVDECATNNGGCSMAPKVHCINTYGSYHCGECPLGWTGDGRSCQRTSTDENTGGNTVENCRNPGICYPGATCTEISNTVVCTCPSGMVGNGYGSKGCITATTKNCGSFPCLNGGTCYDTQDSYACLCPMGFKPPNCTPLPNACSPNPCQNNGECIPMGTTFTCKCPPGYTGRQCDTQISRCGGVLAGLRGNLKYPQGSLYEHNAQCAWLIRTNETLVLNVTFNAFELEDSTECRFDWLQLNDGRTAAAQVIGRFCGLNKPMGGNVISSTNFLYIWFRSDNSTAKEGFDLSWNSIPPQCGGVIDVTSHGSIATPGSPGVYPKNRDCQWLLRASNKRIKLTFFSMQIENHDSCGYDFVEIKDAISDVVLEKFCNSSHPAPLLLPTSEVAIHFHSDNEGADTGFQIYYSLEERIPGCGGTFTEKRGEIKSPTLVGNQAISCEYDIRMPSSESITIEFNKFNMNADDCVELYDVNLEKQITELQAKYCGSYNFVPSIFHSLYNAVKVKYFAKGGEFLLHYHADCSYTFDAPLGSVYSPGYPNLSKVEHFCTYKIITEPGTVISLNMLDFDLKDSSLEDTDCAYSSLTINDSANRRILGPFCNEKEPPTAYVAETNMLTFVFQSGPTTSGKGFKMTYNSLPMDKNSCGGVYTKPGYSIKLPSGDDGNYLHDLECYWVIMAPQGKGILINWKSFSLETTFDCTYDYVEIYDTLANIADIKPLGRYCDARPPPSFLSHSRLLTIKFVSDYSDSAAGFEASFDFVDIRNQCGGDIFSSTGDLFSPGYPENYTAEADCTWLITVPHGSQMELQVEIFELEAPMDNTNECKADWLEVRNGGTQNASLIGRFCGTNMPKTIPSFTNQLRLTFHSDSFISARGFKMSWYVFSNGCGGVLQADTGVITSPFYPQPYPNDAACEWRIRVHPGSSIKIKIEHIDIEDLFQCNYDYLEIFDGHNKADRPLAKLCRMEENQMTFETTSNEALIQFRTDSSNSQSGFLLSYTSDCNRNITLVHGAVESINYGEAYFDGPVKCAWILKAPKGNKIQVEFTDFQKTNSGDNSIYFTDMTANKTKTHQIKEIQTYESTGSTLQILHNDTSVSFRLEYLMKGCIETFHRETGEFETPNFPKTYPNDIECSWIIKVPFGQGIELTIEELDIESSENCTRDALVISFEFMSDHVKERHCGKRDSFKITSSGHQLFVRFYSDSAHNGKGFKASYNTIPTTCGGVIEGKNGVVTSPNYPLNYPMSVNCEWKIAVASHFRIKLTLDDLDIEEFYDCEMDYVAAFDTAPNENGEDEERQLFSKCGQLEENSETTWVTTSNTAEIRFKSDDSNEQKGFKIHFEEICGGRNYITEEDVFTLQVFKHSQQNETCEWQIIAKDNTKRVLLTTTHVQMTAKTAVEYKDEAGCAENGVKIYEGTENTGPLRSKFCKTHPPAIISNGNALTINVPLSTIEEFEAEYMTMDTACGAVLNAFSGKFSSPYYPSSYPVNLECEWLIVASESNTLALTFESFDLEESDGCNNDYVEVREESPSGPLIGVYCGSTTPPAVKGVNFIWIKFKSDNDNVGNGFLASYNYMSHSEVSGENGTIQSPKYPSKFFTNEPYSYRITVDKDYVVLLTLTHLVDTDIPNIKFYDGYSDIGPQIDYSTNHVVISHTNILFFRAQSGPFQFEWERYSKANLQENRTAEENVQTCGNRLVIINQPVVFTSPGYPEGYKDNLDCSWHILPVDKTTHVVLQFTKVDLEDFADCFADNVAVSQSSDLQNWKELDKICKQEPTTIKSYHGTPYLKLDFHTDTSENKTGFSTIVKTACGSVLTDRKGLVNITSLAIGSSIFQMECVWTINVRQGRRVRIRFEEATIRASNDSSGDCRTYFLVRNGIDDDSPFLGKGKYCDNDITDVLDSTSNRAYIKFVRVGFPRFKASFRYEEIMHQCSDDFILQDTPSGNTVTVNSPNYPNIANPHTECIWKITAPVHHIMAVHFNGKFDLTPGNGPIADACDREYVQLNDGATDLLPILGRFCGTKKPDTIYTTGNILRVKYFTDVAEPKAGFTANITIASCGGFYYDSEGVVRIPNNIVLPGNQREAECIYTFEAARDSVVRVDINIELPEDNNCSTVTHLELQEIDSYGEQENITDTLILCGSFEKRFLVETNKLLIILRIKDNFKINDEAKIGYTMLGSRCGETISASTGILQTPGYPNGVTQPTHCVWRLVVPKGKRIKIEFLDFDSGLTTSLTNSSTRPVQTFRGRITFSNDFQMQSVIARVLDNPHESVYSTDNTMTVDAFLLSIGRHRGFKLRFSSEEFSEICPRRFGLIRETSLEFRSNVSVENYCNYHLLPLPKQTLALTIAKYEQYEALYLPGFLCEIFAPAKFKAHETKLFTNLFCRNATFPLTLRFPYPTVVELIGNKRNKLSLLELNYKHFGCGGIIAVYPVFIGENTTITSPQMENFSGRLDCAWAVWPSDQADVTEWEEQEVWREMFQLEVSLSTDFKGKCEDQFLILYNGPDQNSPELGRYCGQATASHLVAQGGLFVEYFVANYESVSKFNITGKQGSGCGGKLNYPYRSIRFDSEYYKNNVECIWDIEVEAGFNLNVVFVDRFFIESSEGCKKDYLKIQQRFESNEDFQDIKTLCGREPPAALTATGNRVRVIFRSDADTLGDGFQIDFERTCGGILHAKREIQTLQSPGFPTFIPNNLYCNYTILAPSSTERGILLRFNEFNVEAPPINKCLFDNVTVIEFINNQQEETVLCGVKRQLEFRSQDRIEIIIRTDQTFPSKGFSLHYSNNVCGGLITNSTLIESPHQQADGNFPPSMNCFWNITAPENYKILIKFEELDFEAQSDCTFDSVEIYKGAVPVLDQRLAKLCGNLTGQLPMLSIPSNKVIIKSESDERDPSKGFKALVTMMRNCDVQIFLGSMNTSYEFTSFSGHYDDDLDCSYVFRTEPGRQLQIEFTSFHIEEKVGCTADYLDIRDGAGPFADEIGRFCGHVTPIRMTSSRNALLVRFVSDSSVTSFGFSAHITSIPLACGKHNIDLESDKKFVLKSPDDGSGKYPTNLNCFWKIKSASYVHLKFDKFDLERKTGNDTCSGDYLKIYNSDDAEMVENGYGSSVVLNGHSKGIDFRNFATEHIYCGNFIPSDYISNSKELYLKFKTDNSGSGSGFSIEAFQAQGCYRNFTGTQGRIFLADTSDHCDIHLQAPDNYTLSIYFKLMSFGEYECNLEYIEVFDAHTNTSLKKFCNYVEAGRSIFSNSNELRLRLKMNTKYTEYDITYLASRDGPGCGGDFYNTEGIFTNPFYPDNVRNNSNCRWNIRVPSNLLVLLRFDVFDLGSKTTCTTDYLEIIEHTDSGEEKVMRHWCGGDQPKVYKSERNYLTVYFHKTVNYDGTGWVLRFYGVYSNYIIPSYYLNNDY